MTKKLSKASSRPHAINFSQHPSRTQQHSKAEVDINNIMARYIKTGVLDHVAKYKGQYLDNSAIDYHESQNILLKADAMFDELPSSVRKQFKNSPAEFLDFVNNEENHSKLAEMGLTNTPFIPDETGATPAPTPAKTETSTEQPTETAPAPS